MSHTYRLADLQAFLASVHRVDRATGGGLSWRIMRAELADLGGYYPETRGQLR